MTNADQHTQWPCSGSRDDMLKHLWRSLTEFRRTSRLASDMTTLLTQGYEFIGGEFRPPTDKELRERAELNAHMQQLVDLSNKNLELSKAQYSLSSLAFDSLGRDIPGSPS